MADLHEADLTTKKRDSLKDSQFAYVDDQGVGHLPLPDASHVRNALARFNQTTMPESAKAGAMRKIRAAAKRFGVEVGGDDKDDKDSDGDKKDVSEAANGRRVYHEQHHHGAVQHAHAHYHDADDEGATMGQDGGMSEGREDHSHCPKCGSDDRLCGHRQRTKAAVPPASSGPSSAATMSESISLVEARTDRGKREVLLRIISPGFGSSRDPASGLPVYYTEAALQEAAPLFAGKKCFLNHDSAQERKARPEGDITRWGATIKESWWDGTHRAPVGRTRVINSALWEAIELDPDEVACSIRAHGTGRVGSAEGQPAWLCEHIDAVQSVDFVTYAGARGGVIQILESDRAAVRFSPVEQQEATRDMLEDLSEADLREARPDLVAALQRGMGRQPAVDLTEALRPYQERVARAEERSLELERRLNNRDALGLVDSALAACALPAAATARVRVQFAEATYGFDGAAYETDAQLVAAVGTAATQEADYIKSVSGPEARRTITGMGAAARGTVGGTPAPKEASRTALSEAQRSMDLLLAPVAQGKKGGAAEAALAPAAQASMDALVGTGR